jgi:16S rRNA (guanine527-N7)-methyltransferase
MRVRLEPTMDVSRETAHTLEPFVELLTKWNRKINLISRDSERNLWQRHILDSLQVLGAAPEDPRIWIDLGSGGGFPALVAAIVAKERGWRTRFTCVDSDQRKATFLRVAAHDLRLPVDVHAARIQELSPIPADVVSARALADLPSLLDLSARFRTPHTTSLFPKGKTWREELEKARLAWHLECEILPSTTSPEAVILKIGEASRVAPTA